MNAAPRHQYWILQRLAVLPAQCQCLWLDGTERNGTGMGYDLWIHTIHTITITYAFTCTLHIQITHSYSYSGIMSISPPLSSLDLHVWHDMASHRMASHRSNQLYSKAYWHPFCDSAARNCNPAGRNLLKPVNIPAIPFHSSRWIIPYRPPRAPWRPTVLPFWAIWSDLIWSAAHFDHIGNIIILLFTVTLLSKSRALLFQLANDAPSWAIFRSSGHKLSDKWFRWTRRSFRWVDWLINSYSSNSFRTWKECKLICVFITKFSISMFALVSSRT